jgi:uncharacterized protein (DUF362 family)
MDPIKRRDFIKHLLALSAASLAASGCAGQAAPQVASAEPRHADQDPPAGGAASTSIARPPTSTAAPFGSPHLAVARGAGTDPAELTRRAVAALGGIERFVKSGANVIIKPNICNGHRGPEYATTTNPDLVAALVSLCLGAGAARVRVIDYNFSGANPQAYSKSGIESAVNAAGGEMELINRMRFRKTSIPGATKIKEWKIYGDVLDADVVINVPIAKHHSSGTLTLGMKNLMGVIDDRSGFHARGLHECIVDLSRAVRPQLTIVDAVRILTANGPTGGSLDDVRRLDTVIASSDIVTADAYAATLFGLSARDVKHIRLAGEAGLGQADLTAIKIEEIAL